MKRILFTVFTIFIFVGTANAQFEAGKSHVGPSIGIGFGGYGLSIGADYEYGMKMSDIGVEAPGLLGIGGIVRYYSWSSDTYLTYKWTYTDIIIGAQGNYHFKVGDGKLDPWVGLILGFDIASSSWDGPSGFDYSATSSGGMFFNGNAGVRYWFSPSMAARASLGFGSIVSSIILGVDFKF